MSKLEIDKTIAKGTEIRVCNEHADILSDMGITIHWSEKLDLWWCRVTGCTSQENSEPASQYFINEEGKDEEN